MPIVDLQRRLREAGRIRLGDKTDKGYPRKLTTFRFTARDQTIIDAAAQLYGGTTKPWGDQWEVLTRANALEVIVPPADMAFSQWFELWSGGGCQRRCDGSTELLHDTPCQCDPDPAKRECSPHTRLSLILPDLPTVGLWRLDTQGWNAATELAGSVDLALAFAQRGTYLPAQLRLEQREQRKPGEPTKKFVVPILDLQVPMRALAQMSGAGAGDNGAVGKLPAPSFTPVPDTLTPAPTPSITEQLAPRTRTPRANAAVPIPSTGLEPGPQAVGDHTQPEAPPTEPAGGGAIPATTPPPDGPTLSQDQFIAMEIGEALGDRSDDTRHAFLTEFSDGRYSSAKDVPIAEMAGLRAELVRRKQARTLPVEDVIEIPVGEELFPDSDLEQLSAGELRRLAEDRGLITKGTTARTGFDKPRLLQILKSDGESV